MEFEHFEPVNVFYSSILIFLFNIYLYNFVGLANDHAIY